MTKLYVRREARIEHDSRFPHIRELDGVRGIAALMVFAHHVLRAPGDWHGFTGSIIAVSEYGNTGVDLFFVLSGFLITSLLYKDRYSDSYWHDFYWKRALRILPLYFVVLAVMAAFGMQLSYLLLCLTFLANCANLFHLFPLGPFWSLAIEEQFYLVWPAVLRRRSLHGIRRIAITVAAGSAGLRFLLAFWSHENYVFTPLHCDGLAFGAWLACEYLNEDRRMLRRFLSLLLVAGGTLVAGVRILLPGTRYQFLFAPTSQTGIVLITGALVGLVIWSSGSFWLAPLRSRLLTFFGLISYAFYMLHDYAIALYDHHFRSPYTQTPSWFWTRAVMVLLGSVVFSVISRYALELPAMSLRRFVLYRPSPDPKAGEPSLPLANL